MNAQTPPQRWDAVAIDGRDSVAVAMRPLQPGPIAVRVDKAVRRLTLLEPVGIGHKIALRPIADGEDVRKYGEVIGVATAAIAEGAHVHVHNIKSHRAQTARRR